jgi:hypothetical protein
MFRRHVRASRELRCAPSCASRKNAQAREGVDATISAGPTPSSRTRGCSLLPQPSSSRDAPDEETIDRRAVWGEPHVRFGGGEAKAFPTLILTLTLGAGWKIGDATLPRRTCALLRNASAPPCSPCFPLFSLLRRGFGLDFSPKTICFQTVGEKDRRARNRRITGR